MIVDLPHRPQAAVRTTFNTSLGALTAVATDEAVVEIAWPGHDLCGETSDVAAESHPVLRSLVGQLNEYFSAERRDFDVPIALHGTPFQQRVWEQLRQIPYGEVTTYAAVARLVTCRSARAVGTAIGRNPVPIIVPCHRVIGSDKQLRGFAGGLPAKRMLLSIEGAG